MTQQIDDTDRALIAALQENARLSTAALGRRLGLARSTVQARLDRLERSGAILGYTLRLGDAARPALRAFALVGIEPRAGPAVLARLRSLPQVVQVDTTSGRVDLLVQIAAESTQALDDTLDRIGEIRGVRSSESLIRLSTKIDRGG